MVTNLVVSSALLILCETFRTGSQDNITSIKRLRIARDRGLTKWATMTGPHMKQDRKFRKWYFEDIGL